MLETFKKYYLEEFLKIMIVSDLQINFNLREILHKFLRFLESTRRSSWSTLMTFWENCKKILKKFKRNRGENFKDAMKIIETLLGETEIGNSKLILLIWGNFNFSDIGKKLRRNLRKTLKKYRKHFAQT